MTQHLLALELGPVVQIIAAARKTRDHYFGSWMLSEIAKAVAKRVAEACGDSSSPQDCLISPAPHSLEQLDDPHFAIGDEILALVPRDKDPRHVADLARQAAHNRWLDFAREAKQATDKNVQPASRPIVHEASWNVQVREELIADTAGEVVELYAAWSPWADTMDYQACLSELKRLLFGRTACRNFPPALREVGPDNSASPSLPKSSLDGRRDSVLVQPEHEDKPLQSRKLRLNRGEQLDALGVTKRAGQGAMNFPSTARLAADPWIRGTNQAKPEALERLREECQKLARSPRPSEVADPILGHVATNPDQFPTYPQYKAFPYEGAILFENRHHEFVQEAADSRTEEDVAAVDGRLTTLKSILKRLVAERGEPNPYFVAMVADGDGIGNRLGKCKSPKEHREFSLRLSEFAGGVRRIVDKYQGALVFAAGEDISALLTLDGAIECADELRTKFASALNDEETDDEGAPSRVTLSVGLAIGHFLDPLEDTLDAAREMEGLAKQGTKNSLAVEYRSRGGAPIRFCACWNEDPLSQLTKWMELLRNNLLPDKVAYDLRNLAKFYETWPTQSEREKQERREALHADALRLLSRKKLEARDRIAPLLMQDGRPKEIDVVELANTIIIAGMIDRAKRQSEGGRG